jgi:hypothetical protein
MEAKVGDRGTEGQRDRGHGEEQALSRAGPSARKPTQRVRQEPTGRPACTDTGATSAGCGLATDGPWHVTRARAGPGSGSPTPCPP